MNPTSKINRKTPCAAALLIGLVTFLLLSATTQAATPPSLNWNGDTGVYSFTVGGSSTNNSTPGMKITLPAYTELNQTGWELTSFTWLSSSGTSAAPTGRGYVLIFDDTFDPNGKPPSTVNTSTTGLIATSGEWTKDSTKIYPFTNRVVLEAGASYYFLNNQSVTTAQTPAAPYNYGFNNTATIANVERWNLSGGNWIATVGAPNFSMTLTPVISNVPEPATVTTVLGLVGIACFLFKRRR
ncbi:hypothetical protein OPIT5_19355 [Opitutaceae bacterium TAV5]|nr:hypothetical protein OPIT5_19355 [Opitutaceae bacterium TAV5]